jgi:tetratricopeptide (TPR) repeat protein
MAKIKFNPDDLEIQLQKARCYRSLGHARDLERAEQLISRIEGGEYNERFHQRILREKALTAERLGNVAIAEEYYRQAIAIPIRNPYPEVYVGLALILVRKIDELPLGAAEEKNDLASEAVKLLEVARKRHANFDRYHLGVYVEVLIQAGQEDVALPLLEEALKDNPTDGRLNFRMAEILRQEGQYNDAEAHAIVAYENRYLSAMLTHANILYSQAIELENAGEKKTSEAKLQRALGIVSDFKARCEAARGLEVADSIAAKTHRTMGKWEKARETVDKYKDINNPYIVYEQCRIDLNDANTAIMQGDFARALESVYNAIGRVIAYRNKYNLPQALVDLNTELDQRRIELETALESEE